MTDDGVEDIDQRLDDLDEKESELSESAHFRSACRVANEIRRLAKAERRLLPYIRATFTLMNHAADMLDPEMGRDASLEIIGLLESEDRARSIQPDLPETEYMNCVDWYSSCGYDNLAKATAYINGYNSPGMHACIADGIEVCRRTGKSQCITCFREYATEVYRAADDVDMAMHFAQMGVANVNPGPHDRRWAGAQDLVSLHLRNGNLKLAAESAQLQMELCEVWHSPRRARMATKYDLIEIAHLIGEPTKWDGAIDEAEPPSGEYPALEIDRDLCNALIECCNKNYDRAVELLTKCDQILTKKGCLPLWFMTRLRLLSTLQVAIRNDYDPDSKYSKLFERLASQLETKAIASRDYLSLTCLKRLRDPDATIAPIPTLGDFEIGPFANAKRAAETGPIKSDDSNEDEDANNSEGSNKLDSQQQPIVSDEDPGAILGQSLYQRYIKIRIAERDETTIDDSLAKLQSDLIAYSPAVDSQPNDCLPMLALAPMIIDHGDQSRAIWEWAQGLSNAVPDNARAKNLLADLGATLLFGPNDSMKELISEKEVEQLFARSLEMDRDAARNYQRAGDFYRFVENIGEAERCYARAFRLDRTNPEVAESLSRIYRATDRQRDALAVLDMAIREGGPNSDLCWSAAMLANRLEQHEASLTYLDAYETLHDDMAWVQHYRGVSLLALERPAEALEAVEIEAKRNPDCPYGVLVQRAAIQFALKNDDSFRTHLSEVLDHRLSQIDYLTVGGLMNMYKLLWDGVQTLEENDPLRQRFLDVVVASGCAPDEVFDWYRNQNEATEGLNFYQCTLHQPLDERWPDWFGCMNEESEYKQYSVVWGILAESEENATKLALEWQSRSFPLPATVAEVDCVGQDYRDCAGVVWQGERSVPV